MENSAVILLGHGSRAEKANKVFASMVENLAGRLDYQHVAGAAMELTEPTLETRVDEFVDYGIDSIIILPLFLFPGIHVQRDIPEMVEKLENKYPEVEFKLGDIIGDDDRLTEILQDRLKGVN